MCFWIKTWYQTLFRSFILSAESLRLEYQVPLEHKWISLQVFPCLQGKMKYMMKKVILQTIWQKLYSRHVFLGYMSLSCIWTKSESSKDSEPVFNSSSLNLGPLKHGSVYSLAKHKTLPHSSISLGLWWWWLQWGWLAQCFSTSALGTF